MRPILCLLFAGLFFTGSSSHAQQLTTAGGPAELMIRKAGHAAIRISLAPLSLNGQLPANPSVALADGNTVLRLRRVTKEEKHTIGDLTVAIRNSPLTISVYNRGGRQVQQLLFTPDGNVSFQLNGDEKILGMGEGGPKPERGSNWRTQPVQYDRRGKIDSMQPRWQGDMYGSRNPVATLAGTSGWGLFVAAPWVWVDLRAKNNGVFTPVYPAASSQPQTEKNQQQNMGKGLPPADQVVKGLFDVFVFDAQDPTVMLRDYSRITGVAALPPKWALGYMQSHRTLENDAQMTGIVDTFRQKKIPIDAVIYLGTGFTPSGWNTKQPSFDFNPEVFKTDPQTVINKFHNDQVKVILHMVPWDRDRLPGLHGNIPALPGEVKDGSHIESYWKQHENLVKMGVDGFWPDEGDWFNLYERIKRHQLYYQGSLSSSPGKRPWSLQRNGYPGIAQWGGWVWSGDTESSWKTLEAQIAVGINYSLSIAPFWGSDIGGFYPSEEYTGELYARWHQFASFNASFRSHGRSWWLHLPWGWGRSAMGPAENRAIPLRSEMNNPTIEPVIKQYNELRYRLLSYAYTLAWEAREYGLPMMRALWVHYPNDAMAAATGNAFLWGKNILVAPVYEKNATSRKTYLPAGTWYDWWNNEKQEGGAVVERKVDLATMPLYVKAGAIIPVDALRQFTSEKVDAPLTLKIYEGDNGSFVLYEDDGTSQDYLKGKCTQTRFTWDDAKKILTIEPAHTIAAPLKREFVIERVSSQRTQKIEYAGKKMQVSLAGK